MRGGVRKWAPKSKSQFYLLLPYDGWKKHFFEKTVTHLCMFKMISVSWGVMHLYELFACFALISRVLVCVVFALRGIYQEFGCGLAPFRLGIWTGMSGEPTYWRRMLDKMTVG